MKGLTPEQRALLRLQREALQAQERMERERARTMRAVARTSALRDVGASMMQASASNPLWSQALIGTAGATFASLGGFLSRARSEAAAAAEARGISVPLLRPGQTLGQSPFETLGEGMMTFAAAKGTASVFQDIMGAFRSESRAVSLGFDLGGGGGGGAGGASAMLQKDGLSDELLDLLLSAGAGAGAAAAVARGGRTGPPESRVRAVEERLARERAPRAQAQDPAPRQQDPSRAALEERPTGQASTRTTKSPGGFISRVGRTARDLVRGVAYGFENPTASLQARVAKQFARENNLGDMR